MTQALSFTVEMSDLKRYANFVRNALGNSKTDLGVMLIRFEVSQGQVKIFASDKEIYALASMKAAVEDSGKGSFAVLGSKIEKLISQVDAETVVFKADKENVEVKAGYLTVNFEVYDDAQLGVVQNGLLAEAENSPGDWVVLPKAALEEGLICAKSCTTSNSIRPDVTHAEAREGRILSSDGRKIMIYSHDAMPENLAFKVPAVALTGLIGCVKNTETENEQIREGKSYYHIKSGGGSNYCGVRKIERSFPRVEEMILKADTPSDEVSVDKLLFESMVRGVSLGLSSDEVKVNITISGEGAEATMQVAAMNQVGRVSFEKASCGRKGKENLTFPVSYKHLIDTLGVFKGDSVVDMQILVERSILLVRDTTDARQVLTVIPFRTVSQEQQEKKEAEEMAKAREKVDEKKTSPEEPASVQDALAVV